MITIRPATPADARGIAEVQVDSYRTAYAPFFPPGFFDEMTYDEQANDWAEWLEQHPEDILLVAVEPASRVVGYVLARAEAKAYPAYEAEVMALHVRGDRQRQGVGAALLYAAVDGLARRGCGSVMLSTLQGNPIRTWYEALGGELIGEKRDDFDGWEVIEVIYGWPDIGSLQNNPRLPNPTQQGDDRL